MAEKKSRLRFILPPVITVIAIIIMVGITLSKRKPPKMEHHFSGVLVDVMKTGIESRFATVTGHGTVRPRHEVTLSPQVGGKVEWVDPRFVAGGQFRKGEALIRIEQEDYLLGVEQAQAAVAGAEYALAVATADAEVAGKEWKTMQSATKNITGSEKRTPDALVLREPQLKQAEANLASAKAALSMAQLRLERTEITAPFNCHVRFKSVDPGQLVNVGTPTGAIYSTDLAEIEVGIPIGELMWLEIPGAKATVRLTLDETVKYEWEGKIVRGLGTIDERERLARVVVQVRNPYASTSGDKPALNVGTFVEVEIQGREINDIIPLPRKAIRDESTVWISTQDSLLEVRKVKVERLTTNEALVSDGIMPGEYVILSPVTGAATGLKVKPVGG